MHNITLSGYKIGLKFNKSILAVEQHSYVIVNAYIAYDLDDWPQNLINNFTLKSCLFGATNIVTTTYPFVTIRLGKCELEVRHQFH